MNAEEVDAEKTWHSLSEGQQDHVMKLSEDKRPGAIEAFSKENAKKIRLAATDRMSFSRLSVYNSCGEKFRLSYIEKWPKAPSGFFIGGQAVHETIEESEKQEWYVDHNNYMDKGDPGFDFFQDKFTEKMKNIAKGEKIYWGGKNNGEDERWWRSQGPVFLRRYSYVRQDDVVKGYTLIPEGVEMSLLADLPGGHKIKMYVDAFPMVDPDGTRIVRDYKTGKTGQSDPIQLATYAYGVSQAFQTSITSGEFVYLRSADPEKRVEPMNVEKLIPMVTKIYGDSMKLIQEGFFPLRPSFFCKSCNVREGCAYGSLL